MQYVNNDMDDLFRRAAKDYPLDTNSSDWNKVSNALNNPEIKPESTSNRRRFLWLLMLIPVGLIWNQYLSPGDNIANKNGSIYLAPPITVSVENKRIGEKDQDDQTNISGNSNLNTFEKVTSNPVKENTSYAIADESNKRNMQSINASVSKKHHTVMIAKRNKLSNNDIKIADQYNISSQVNENGISQVKEIDNNFFTAFIPVIGFQKNLELQLPLAQEKRIVNNLLQAGSLQDRKKFYAGIMGGIDATSVQSQKIENLGYDAGILLGYDLNKKWSIETGIFLDKKFYYTQGKYFDKSRIAYMPANTWITDVSGNCKMIEIPVSVKYTMKQNNTSSLFCTVGLSSYIMKLEDYTYKFYYATPGTYATYEKYYKNSSTHLFSVVSVSAGYSRKIGNIGDLRIEPYFKIPASGVGFGKLSLRSTGIHVGMTRKLF